MAGCGDGRSSEQLSRLQVEAIFHTGCRQDEWLIVNVEHVQNLPQRQLYQAHKVMVESRRHGNHANEKRLFHGTDWDTIPKINRNSFNMSVGGKNATEYGKGVYFIVDASYSIDTYSRLTAKATSTCTSLAVSSATSASVTTR